MQKAIVLAAFVGLSHFVAAQSDSAAVYLQKGLTEKERGRRLESLKQFEKAYAFNRQDKAVVSELAAAYLDLKRYGLAREKFLQLESMGDRTDSTYRQLMLLSFNMRQFDDAIKYAGLLKKADPAAKTAFYSGKAYYEKEDLGNAIRFLEAAAKEDPTNAEIPYTVARAYADMQNFKAAIPHFQKAVQLNPTNTRWIYEMALIYYGMNDDANSLKYMVEAGEKGYKKDNEYLQNLATAYINAGKPTEGIATLQEVLQRRPSDLGVLEALADACYGAKRYDDAIGYYDALLKANERNAEALYMMGMSYQKKGDKQRGTAMCDQAIKMDPSLQHLKQKKEMPVGF
jgi:tetratricopeptide (TPR) repeat protein